MSKECSTYIKAIAILLMLWLHLFSDQDVAEQLDNSIYLWNGQPLCFTMKKIGNLCVTIFIFISGYGLTIKRLSSVPCPALHPFRRIASLYINFWVIFGVACCAALFLRPTMFEGGCYDFITSITALNSCYNGAWWFLLPYCVLVCFAQRIIDYFSKAKKSKMWCSLILIIALHVASYVLLEQLEKDDILSLLAKNLLRTLFLLLMFVCGVLYARHNVIERFPHLKSQWQIVVSLLALCMLKLVIGASSLLNPPFVLIMIPLFAQLKLSRPVKDALSFVGRHSTNMWK